VASDGLRNSDGLSIVATLRNDGHGGYQLEKLQAFLRSIVELANRYDVNHEVILVEWNPQSWAKSLADVIKPYMGSHIRIVTVPSDIHNSLAHSDKIEFFQMIGKNVGIRRAKYRWVLSTNPDQIFNDKCFSVIHYLDPEARTFYRAFRTDIDMVYIPEADVDKMLARAKAKCVMVHDGIWKPPLNLHTHACGDFTLMRKDHWDKLRGYPEIELWSIHLDSLGLVYFTSRGFGEQVIGGATTYHPRHLGSWMVSPEMAKTLPCIQLQWLDAASMILLAPGSHIIWNKETWGMSDRDLPEVELC
jgi:hypothetical protein